MHIADSRVLWPLYDIYRISLRYGLLIFWRDTHKITQCSKLHMHRIIYTAVAEILGKRIVFIGKSNIAARQIFYSIYDVDNMKSVCIFRMPLIAKEDRDIKGMGCKSQPITRYMYMCNLFDSAQIHLRSLLSDASNFFIYNQEI